MEVAAVRRQWHLVSTISRFSVYYYLEWHSVHARSKFGLYTSPHLSFQSLSEGFKSLTTANITVFCRIRYVVRAVIALLWMITRVTISFGLPKLVNSV